MFHLSEPSRGHLPSSQNPDYLSGIMKCLPRIYAGKFVGHNFRKSTEIKERKSHSKRNLQRNIVLKHGCPKPLSCIEWQDGDMGFAEMLEDLPTSAPVLNNRVSLCDHYQIKENGRAIASKVLCAGKVRHKFKRYICLLYKLQV